jgi:hypothetical protein
MRASLSIAVVAGCFLALALGSAACGSDVPHAGSGDDAAPIGQTSSAVINGQLDTTHQAVVAIVLQQGQQGGLCSGTIVKVDPKTHVGWVLTAAHCVDIPPVFVLQGNDFAQSASVLSYDIVDYEADSRWGGQVGSPYDFAVIRIAGVDASTPTIPIVSAPDGLANGTPVVSVGYGRTSLISSGPGDENSVRRRVSKTLGQVGQTLAYDMRSSGICQGDSGGPVIATIGGQERVVGVHSYVQGDCNGVGVSGRVTFNATFIAAALSKAVPTEDCDLCTKIANSGNSVCAAATKKCLADKACSAYYECLSSGRTKTSCLAQFPKAEGPFNAAANCTCNQACGTACKGTSQCLTTPKCGYSLPAGSCAQCTEAACCAEALDCAADGTCYVCLKTKDAAAECATNAARKKMATCVATKCSTECAGSGLDTGADPPAEEAPADPENGAAAAPTTKTVTTTGCSITRAVDASCSSYGSSGAPWLLVGLAGVVGSVARRARRARRVRSGP